MQRLQRPQYGLANIYLFLTSGLDPMPKSDFQVIFFKGHPFFFQLPKKNSLASHFDIFVFLFNFGNNLLSKIMPKIQHSQKTTIVLEYVDF